VLLLDSLNTQLEDQMFVREQAKSFLKTLRPGSRIAIFVMSMRLRFVQGFADDPAILATALGYRKNDKPEPSVLLPSRDEALAEEGVIGMMSTPVGTGPNEGTSASPAMIQALGGFLGESHYAMASDREYHTLENIQELATFLGGFPGRKNLVWLSGDFPLALFGQTATRFEGEVKRTINLLNAARVSIYPIDARGVLGNSLYTANNNLSSMITSPRQLLGPPPGLAAGSPNGGQGGFSASLQNENIDINASHSTMEMLARETGGQFFHNSNRLGDAIGKAVEASRFFYTISYMPPDQKMDGTFRNIDVEVNGAKYTLSFRRGYFALDQDLPGAAKTTQQQAREQQAAQDPIHVDPLRPFMEFGMPQTEQVLYKALIRPIPETPDAASVPKPAGKGPFTRYSVDFAVDMKDLKLNLDSDGDHVGTINVSLVAYDRYGAEATRGDYIGQLDIKPDDYEAFQLAGMPIHEEIEVPKGQLWLRTGVYDQLSHKVGTMEIPFSSVKPLEVAAQ
jgi:VWFA-related protein